MDRLASYLSIKNRLRHASGSDGFIMEVLSPA
jgi:hypothetical protein